MKDWNRYVDEWLNASSSMVLVDDEFDIMEQELFRGFDKLTEEFDRAFNDDLNEIFSGSNVAVRSETVLEEVQVTLYNSNRVHLRSNNKTRVREIRRNIKPAHVHRGNSDYDNLIDDYNVTGSTIPLSKNEQEERETLEDVIVTDKKIKFVSQLPINNKREDIKVVARNDNSVTISHLNSEGKRYTRTSVIPYDIDVETARSTYRNGVLDITFDRK
jgi:HSP20 family molecular chaperone IbpA